MILTNGFWIVPLVQILSVIFGGAQALKALWILRNGVNQREFIIRGMVAVIIFSLPWCARLILSFVPPIVSHG